MPHLTRDQEKAMFAKMRSRRTATPVSPVIVNNVGSKIKTFRINFLKRELTNQRKLLRQVPTKDIKALDKEIQKRKKLGKRAISQTILRNKFILDRRFLRNQINMFEKRLKKLQKKNV